MAFRLSTSEPRTDLYGIGTGEAQVIDLGITERKQQEAARQQQAQERQKKAEEDKRGEEINQQLAAMGKVSIMPRDRDLIYGKQQAVRDYVIKNIDALNKGDVKAQMGFDNLYGDVMTTGEQSKNARENWEAVGQQVAKSPEKYRPESLKAYLDFAHPDQAGNMQFDPSVMKQNYDYGDHLTKDLFPYAKSVAGANEKGYSSNFSIKQAKQTIVDDLKDPQRFEQAAYDFDNAKDKLGAKDPVEYYQNLYAPKLVINSTKPLPEFLLNGETHKNDINVTHTIDNEGGVLHVMNKNNNEEVSVQHDKEGNVVGGVLGTRLSPEEKAQNDKVQASNIAKKKLFYSNVEKAKADAIKNELTVDEAASLFPNGNSPEYKQEPLPHKEKNISLDKQQTLEVAHDKFGLKAHDIIAGKGQKNVDVQKVDNRKETKKINGVEYTLEELKTMAKAAKKSDADAEAMWNNAK